MDNWRKRSHRLVRWLADDGRLAPFWTVNTATDMLWSLMSIDLLDRLITDRRWSRERVTEHLATLFRSTFLKQSGRPADAAGTPRRPTSPAPSSIDKGPSTLV